MTLPWLDVHYLEPFTAEDLPAAFALARKILRSLAESLCRIAWDQPVPATPRPAPSESGIA